MFNLIPSNFQSLFSELIYTYTTSSDRDITIFIENSQNNELIGLKCFYSTSLAQINIAPIVRNYATPQPIKADSGFDSSLDAGYISLSLREEQDDTVSESRVYILSESDSTESELLTSMPLQRALSYGESDMLTYRCAQNNKLTIWVSYYFYGSDEARLTLYYSKSSIECGVATFNLSLDKELITTLFGDLDLERVSVLIEESDSDSEVVSSQTINYIVIDPPATPLRLAWVGSAGSIEQYTFPMIKSMTRYADGKLHLNLTSALETAEVRESLAQIVSSQRVWVDRGDSYDRVEVESSSLSVVNLRELASVELSVICSYL